MKPAVLIGEPWALAPAYPRDLREEIARHVRLHPVEITAGSWKDHREALAQAELVLSSWGMLSLDAEVLAAMPRLEAVFHAAGTIKSFASPEAQERGIVFSSAAEANAIPVAEFALGVILLSLKGFWAHERAMRAGHPPAHEIAVPGIYGSTIGLVSLGAIGRRVAKLLAAHDAKLLLHDPHVTPAAAAEFGAETATLREVFERSDVVSLHTPWLPETENMIGLELVRLMKRGATLINTARGALIDEPGLCEVLSERPDLTAVLDVTRPEPPAPDSPLRALPNVVLTPHIAGSMGSEIARMGRWMVEEMERFVAGQPLLHRVDLAALGRMA